MISMQINIDFFVNLMIYQMVKKTKKINRNSSSSSSSSSSFLISNNVKRSSTGQQVNSGIINELNIFFIEIKF